MIVSEEARAERDSGGLWGFLRLLGRHKLLVALPILVGIVASSLVFMSTPKRYVATAVVALDVRKVTVVPVDTVVSRLPQENPALRTEIDVLGSRSMAERVIDRLGMEALAPLFDPPPNGGGPLQRLKTLVRELAVGLVDRLKALTSQRKPGSAEVVGAPDDARQALVDRLIGGLEVSNDGRSYTIYISFASYNPAFAAKIANSYAEEYFAHHTSIKLEAVKGASEWLGKKVKELRETLEASEQAVETFRHEAGLLEISGASIDDRRLDVLNAELVRARANAAEARARLDNANSMSPMTDGISAFSEALNAPIILALREQQAALLREYQSIRDAGALKSERLASIQSELQSLQKQIHQEVGLVLETLRAEVQVAERREMELEQAVKRQINASGMADKATIHLNELKREAAANRTLYESFLGRHKAIIEQEDLAAPEAQLISKAQPPMAAAAPRLLPLLALGIFLGAGAGLGVAYMKEHLDDRVWSVMTLEERSGLPVLGTLPSRRWIATPVRSLGAKGRGDYSLSLQRLQAVLRLSPITRDAKVIAVSSASRGEGKTFLSIALARTLAASGKSVLVLDADLHRPSLATRLGIKPSFSWDELVRKEKALDDVLQHDPRSNVSVIVAQPSSIAAMTLFMAPAFGSLIAALRERYDLVIVDTPPISAFADAAMVSACSDATLLVVRYRSATYASVIEALRQMALYSLPVAGIVLNRLDPSSSVRYAPAPGRANRLDVGSESAPRQERPSPRLTTVAGGRDLSRQAAAEET